MLPLKSQVLSLERAAVNARIREADRERAQQNADLEREIRGSYAGRHPNGAVIRGRMDHIIVLDHELLFPRCARPGCSRRTGWPPCGGTARGCGVRLLMNAGSIQCDS